MTASLKADDIKLLAARVCRSGFEPTPALGLNIGMAGSRPGRNIKYIYKANFSYGAWRQRYLEAVLRFVQAWNFRYIYMRIISKYVDMNDRPSVAGRKIIDR